MGLFQCMFKECVFNGVKDEVNGFTNGVLSASDLCDFILLVKVSEGVCVLCVCVCVCLCVYVHGGWQMSGLFLYIYLLAL